MDNMGLGVQLGAATTGRQHREKVGLGLQRLMARWMRRKNLT